MENMENRSAKQERVNPNLQAAGRVVYQIGLWTFRLRRIILAIPVLVAAIWLAMQNMKLLPEQVGINLLSTGVFEQTIARPLAVFGPLGLTVGCLALMFLSRKVTYPWLISLFTLVLPLMLRLTNALLG